MDVITYIFLICLEIFIVFTIFAIYFYILVKYFIHAFEEQGIILFFKKHLEFYEPLMKLYKLSSYNAANPNLIQDKIKIEIDKARANGTAYHPNFNTATYILVASVVGMFVIIAIGFLIFHKRIMANITLNSLFMIIILNLVLIVGFELLFVFFVYGNTDLINFAAAFNL